MIVKNVRDYLRDDADIVDRVDEGTDRPGIYAGTVPEKHRGECIVLQAINANHNYSLGGEVADRGSLVQITTYSDNAVRAESLMELVRNRLSGYRGSMGDSDATTVKTCIIENSGGSDIEDAEESSDKFVHSYTVDYKIIHTTAVPTLT